MLCLILLTLVYELYFNNERVALEAPPYDADGQFLMQIRPLPEDKMGCAVVWDIDAQEVKISKDGNVWIMVVGATEYTFNAEIRDAGTTMLLINDRALIPIQPVVESFGYAYFIDDVNHILYVSSGEEPPVTFTVTFDANNGSGVMEKDTIPKGGSYTIKKNAFTRSGYTFDGWNTAAGGSGTSYKAEAAIPDMQADITLFAQWAVATGGGTPTGGSPTGGASTTSSGAVTIAPSPVPAGIINPFTDVAEDAWYFNAVMHVYSKGLMLGTSKTLFSPGSPVTRGMAATIQYRLAGSPDLGKHDNVFTDVVEGAWYAETVNWAASKGLVAGYGDGLFGPEDAVTIEQMAAFLYRVQQFTEKVPPALTEYKQFIDADTASGWALGAVKALAAQGMFDGLPGDRLNPKDVATRAQIASMLSRYQTAVEKLEAAKAAVK